MTSITNDSDQPVRAQPDGALAKPVEFRATGGEFFGIWIVNAILTVLTLGIYSAWATVRVRKYFAGQTYVEGSPLQYHAKGMQLLIGRLLAIGVLILLSVVFSIVPFVEWALLLGVVLVIAIILAVPWVLNRAFRFNNRMTSWRNVRFDWTAGYGATFMVLYIWPLVSLIPFLAPFLWRAQQEFLANSSAFGTRPFALKTGVGPYFNLLFILIGVSVVILLVAIPLLLTLFDAGLIAALEQSNASGNGQVLEDVFGPLFGLYFFGIVGGLFSYAIYYARLRNLSVNNLTLSDVARFESNVHPMRLFWILASNGLLMIVTVGLFTPWALVRYERYVRTSVKTVVVGDLDALIDHESEAGGAFGAELVGLEGIDVGI